MLRLTTASRLVAWEMTPLPEISGSSPFAIAPMSMVAAVLEVTVSSSDTMPMRAAAIATMGVSSSNNMLIFPVAESPLASKTLTVTLRRRSSSVPATG